MKKVWVGVVLFVIALAIWGCAHKTKSTSMQPTAMARVSACGTELQEQWEHVYHRDRLTVKDQCKVVTGFVDAVRSEKDGDYHIRLRLDPGQDGLLNEKNMTAQYGDLVVEPICEHSATQADAIESCADFAGGVARPRKGDHVEVTGVYVHDADHGWMEIHPATRIELIP